MIVREVKAHGFRNLTGSLKASESINILCGDNGQGKTNWLEALYILSSTKSFRTNFMKETLCLHSSESPRQAVLGAAVVREGLTKDLQVQIEENSKHFYINGKKESVTRYLNNLDVVIFCAEELQIVRGEPAERRRFLDRGIVSISPTYLKVISDYNRILKQKNILLKEAQDSERPVKYVDLIASWNEQLIEQATRIYTARVDYTARIRKVLGKQLFSHHSLDIGYRSCLDTHGLSRQSTAQDYRELLKERLQIRIESEIAAGHALIGPHRDELEILLEGQEVSKFGSSGEQRSALITLDLAQISVYNLVFEEYPIFLIDDIDAELDARRIALLLDHIEGKMQVFISTSKRAIATHYQTRANCQYISQGSIVSQSQLTPTVAQLDGELALKAIPRLNESGR